MVPKATSGEVTRSRAGAHHHSGGVSACCWVQQSTAGTPAWELRCSASWRQQVSLQPPRVFGKSNMGAPLLLRHPPSAACIGTSRTDGTHLNLPVLLFAFSLLWGSDCFGIFTSEVFAEEDICFKSINIFYSFTFAGVVLIHCRLYRGGFGKCQFLCAAGRRSRARQTCILLTLPQWICTGKCSSLLQKKTK